MTLTAELGFPDGTIGLLDCSFEQPSRCFYELVGTDGVIEVPDAYLPPPRPTARWVGSHGVENLAFDGRHQYAAMVDAFAEGVANGNKLPAPAEDGLGTMQALDAILAAARTS
jgi:predicted dehydrogenase